MIERKHAAYGYQEAPWLDSLPIVDPRLRRLASYWDSLREGRTMPRFDEIEPWKVPDLLPIMWVWRIDRQRRLMFLRLVGEEVRRVLGNWPRGSELEAVAPPASRHLLRRRYEQVAYGPAILHVRGLAYVGDLRVPAERLILPLGAEATAADDILGISHYDLTPRRQTDDRAYDSEESRETLLPLADIG